VAADDGVLESTVLEVPEGEEPVVEGSATGASVCVAFASPELDRSSVTGEFPSAMLMWLIVRLNMASEARAVKRISRVHLQKSQKTYVGKTGPRGQPRRFSKRRNCRTV
jgi:hypothetical protein